MWRLQRAFERIHHAKLVMLAFPPERPWSSPCLDDKVVSLLKALTIVHRVGIGRPTFDAGAPDEARDQPSARDQIDLGKLFGEANRVIEDREWVTKENDLRLLRDAREDRRFEVHCGAEAGRRVVMLIEHQAVEAYLFAELVFVEVFVIQVRAERGIEVAIGKSEADGIAKAAANVFFGIGNIGSLGKPHNEHDLLRSSLADVSTSS